MTLVLMEATPAHFDWMLGAGAPPPALRMAPGGIDAPDVLAQVRTFFESWMIVADGEVVGLCSFVRAPSDVGVVEIGFGIAASRRGLGHATEAVAAMIAAAGRKPSLRAIVAGTAVGNTASQRVLARNGFAKTGTRHDPEDGEVIEWRRDLGA